MKKIYRLLIIGLLLFNATNIQALNLGEVTDGESGQVQSDVCEWPNYEGCAWNTQDFVIRVSMVDENMQLVEGTKTVEFIPYNPYISGQNYGTYDIDKSNSEYGAITRNNLNRTTYNFVGSHTVLYNGRVSGRSPESMADKGYYVYLGFGKNKAVANDFTDYKNNRQSFIKYVTSLERGIYVQDINKNVDFLSFFLKVSGYDSVWNTTEHLDKTIDLGYNHQYYLIIEPVYAYGVTHNGIDYVARGTAKQLAQFSSESYNRQRWFWIGTDLEVKYNHGCNFIDLNEKYINLASKAGGAIYDQNGHKYTSKELADKYRHYCNSIKEMEKYDTGYPNTLFSNVVANTSSGFGVNMIDIKEVITSKTPKVEKASCTLTVDSCAKTSGETVQPNNDFKIQAKLTNTEGKMANCILPNIASDEQLSEYIYSVGEGNNQLWCYDDITYDFSKLKSTLSDKNFSTNQLVEIPNGTLRVDRTCYTKSSDTNNIYLGTVFETDPGNYQDSFKFSFNNKELVFERNTNKYKLGNTDTYQIETTDCAGRNQRDCKYKYTSTFYYDYELKDALSGNNLNINVSDLSLNNGIKNTNSVEFITSYDKSNAIKINNQYSTGSYTSSLSTQISNGYGLTNKLYEKLLSITTDKKTENEIQINRLSNNNVSGLLEINLEQNSKQTCDVNTTIDNIVGPSVFRVISLNNPFPARDGSSRLPGSNWLSGTDNNVYNYIENNRNVKNDNKDNNAESVYKKEPLYTITLTPSTMIKIREYNKSHNYSDIDMTCESKTGRMCIDNFIRDSKYIPELNGTCKTLTPKEITQFNNRIREFELSGCNNQTQCMTMKKDIVNELDTNKDGYVTSSDYLNADFYTCADKTYRSGG